MNLIIPIIPTMYERIYMKMDELKRKGSRVNIKQNSDYKNDEDVFCWMTIDDIPLTFCNEQEVLDKLDRLLGA